MEILRWSALANPVTKDRGEPQEFSRPLLNIQKNHNFPDASMSGIRSSCEDDFLASGAGSRRTHK